MTEKTFFQRRTISGTTLVDNGADSYVQRPVSKFDPAIAPEPPVSTDEPATEEKPPKTGDLLVMVGVLAMLSLAGITLASKKRRFN